MSNYVFCAAGLCTRCLLGDIPYVYTCAGMFISMSDSGRTCDKCPTLSNEKLGGGKM